MKKCKGKEVDHARKKKQKDEEFTLSTAELSSESSSSSSDDSSSSSSSDDDKDEKEKEKKQKGWRLPSCLKGWKASREPVRDDSFMAKEGDRYGKSKKMDKVGIVRSTGCPTPFGPVTPAWDPFGSIIGTFPAAPFKNTRSQLRQGAQPPIPSETKQTCPRRVRRIIDEEEEEESKSELVPTPSANDSVVFTPLPDRLPSPPPPTVPTIDTSNSSFPPAPISDTKVTSTPILLDPPSSCHSISLDEAKQVPVQDTKTDTHVSVLPTAMAVTISCPPPVRGEKKQLPAGRRVVRRCPCFSFSTPHVISITATFGNSPPPSVTPTADSCWAADSLLELSNLARVGVGSSTTISQTRQDTCGSSGPRGESKRTPADIPRFDTDKSSMPPPPPRSPKKNIDGPPFPANSLSSSSSIKRKDSLSSTITLKKARTAADHPRV